MKRIALLAIVLLASCSKPAAPVAPASTDVPPTSVNAFGVSCAQVTITDGVTVVPEAVRAIGSICRDGRNAAGITSTDCKDGDEMVWAAGLAWWFSGKPAHLAEHVPQDAANLCAYGANAAATFVPATSPS